MRAVFAALIISFAMVTFSSATDSQLNLMPMPASVQARSGQLTIDEAFSVGVSGPSDARVHRALERFLSSLRGQTGISPLSMKITDGATARLVVHSAHADTEVLKLGEDESYSLDISPNGAKLDAATPLGILRGLQTFLQLVQATPDGFAVPAVNIQDKPRFPWRGLMIDVGRHFIPMEVLKRNLDGMEAAKLNVLHWHLSEDQGFRIESKRFPRLQGKGSDWMFFTQAEVRELIAYARDRGIRVVPEFDMPGHSLAWFPGYPELASGPGPYQVERKWGIFDPAMDPTQESTYRFLDVFVGEMAGLFPDQYFHIGGDEVTGKQWEENPKILAFMRIHELRNKKELQAYFNQRLEKLVSKHGKTMVGWDEIMRPDLPKNVIVQAWRDESSVPDEVRHGYRALLSQGYYLDLNWPASQHYAIDPFGDPSANLSAEEKQRVMGGEACMWSEYVSPESIDSRIWPRAAAIAERLWSSQDVRDVNSMYQRLEKTSTWLDGLGLTHNSSYEPMLRRIAGSNDISALRTLADVVEPVKDYTREEITTVPATSLSPINRLIDAARPESMAARQFNSMVDTVVSGHADSAAKQEVRAMLLRWSTNAADLQPLEGQSFLVKEVTPLAQALSTVAAIGLQALDYMDRGERAADDWKTQQLATLQEAQKPKAQLLLMVVSPVEKLVEAAARPRTN